MSFIAAADARLAAVAARQQGVFTRQQALLAGLSRRQIGRRLACGLWVRALPCVYRDAAAPVTDRQRLWAAVLWAGRGSAASHRSAAVVWQLDGVSAPTPEVVVPYARAPKARRVVVHRSLDIPSRDVRRVAGLRVTAPARTLIDLASVVDAETLERAFEDARRRRLLAVRPLVRRLEALGTLGRTGAGTLAALVHDLHDRAPSESALEVKVARLLRSGALPRPERQVAVVVDGRRYRLDFAWRAGRVALEADGRSTHERRVAFQQDRARLTALASTGWRVLVVTWEDVTRRPGWVLARLGAALAPAA